MSIPPTLIRAAGDHCQPSHHESAVAWWSASALAFNTVLINPGEVKFSGGVGVGSGGTPVMAMGLNSFMVWVHMVPAIPALEIDIQLHSPLDESLTPFALPPLIDFPTGVADEMRTFGAFGSNFISGATYFQGVSFVWWYFSIVVINQDPAATTFTIQLFGGRR